MAEDTSKHGNELGHGGFERRDLSAAGIIYFLLGLVAMILLASFVLTRFYDFLDKRENAQQPALSPLLTNVPTDTRHIPRAYPQSVFPNPKLEEDERGQLNGIRLTEEQTLNSYGWVDEKAGTVRIPIERAMDLVAQRGLPVRPQGVAEEKTAPKAGANVGSKKEKK
ncbi:MAG: hypothetical protein WB562_08625 [Candidatus Sulfotelmatobacter sp.]